MTRPHPKEQQNRWAGGITHPRSLAAFETPGPYPWSCPLVIPPEDVARLGCASTTWRDMFGSLEHANNVVDERRGVPKQVRAWK